MNWGRCSYESGDCSGDEVQVRVVSIQVRWIVVIDSRKSLAILWQFRGGTVHRCHGSVRTSVRGSRFDTISVQHEKKRNLCSVSFHLFWTDSSANKKNPSRCENTTYYYIYIYIYAFSRRFYPKRLTLHSSYSFTFNQLLLSLGIEPMILALLAPCSTIWATGKLFTIYI